MLPLTSALGLIFLAALCLFVLCDTGVSSLSRDTDRESAHVEPGHQRVQALARHYEVVDVDTSHHLHHVRVSRQRRSMSDNDGSYAHPDKTSFKVNAFGQSFHLQLELNKVLLPKGFHVRSYTADGEVVIDKHVVNCYYQGRVRGLNGAEKTIAAESHAVVSTCNGISGSFGVGPAGHWTKEETYFIEPLTADPAANGTHLHAVFKAGDAKSLHRHPHARCGVSDNATNTKWHRDGMSFTLRHSTHNGEGSHHRLRRNVQTATKYVELLIVMDNSLYSRFNGDLKFLGNRAIEVANFLDSVYLPLNVRVPLVAAEVFSAGDRFPASSNAGDTLIRFINYRVQYLVNKIAHDNAQLLTGHDISGEVLGVAYLDAMCGGNSGGINEDDRYNPSHETASIVAHEMGHNLGMEHDTASCNCSAPTDYVGCIMGSKRLSDDVTRTWSSCSRSYLAKFLKRSSSACLNNVPTQRIGSPVCGDGFLEGNEQCDCGPPKLCTNKCCNPNTCQLSAGSQCSTGPCCNDCQYSTAGTLCRAAVNSCDVPETCSGLNHTCPDNLFTQNGLACGSGASASFCYNGQCNTHDSQCKRTWGPASSVAPKPCYDANTYGQLPSHCGYDSNGQLIRCSQANAPCGSLQCLGGPTYTILPYKGVSFTTFADGGGNQIINCKSTSVIDTGEKRRHIYTADGVVCAANSICLNKVCRSITSLPVPSCPSRGGRVCSGNGVCTNLNSCLCNRGWTGTDCSTSSQVPVTSESSSWTTWSRWADVGNCSLCRSDSVNNYQVRSRTCRTAPLSSCHGSLNESRACQPCAAAADQKGLSSGATAGLVIGLLLLCGAVSAIAIFLIRHRNGNKQRPCERSTSAFLSHQGSRLTVPYTLTQRNESHGSSAPPCGSLSTVRPGSLTNTSTLSEEDDGPQNASLTNEGAKREELEREEKPDVTKNNQHKGGHVSKSSVSHQSTSLQSYTAPGSRNLRSTHPKHDATTEHVYSPAIASSQTNESDLSQPTRKVPPAVPVRSPALLSALRTRAAQSDAAHAKGTTEHVYAVSPAIASSQTDESDLSQSTRKVPPAVPVRSPALLSALRTRVAQSDAAHAKGTQSEV